MSFVCPDCGMLYEQAGFCGHEGTKLLPRDDEMLGRDLGRYRVTRLLGVGGMGRVYAAVQPSIGARVAVKVLAAEYSERQELIDRFFAEARAVNLIRHEQIVNVLDLAQFSDGRPYIIMEYLDGVPLANVIARRGKLPLGTLAGLVAEVLDALAAAHARHIVHRDLKPDNIFVSPNGHAKVLDFGIAKLDPGLGGAQSATRAGSIMGTPPYMSPEQALAKPVDERADLYSMGVILYEAATGELPFTGQSLFEVLRKHIEVPPRPPRELRPEIPPEYEKVILRALEKDPAKRYQTAHEMATALVAAAQGLPPPQWQTLRGETSALGGAGVAPQITPLGARPGMAATFPVKRSNALKIVAGVLVLGAAAAVAVVLATRNGGGPKPVAAASDAGAAARAPLDAGKVVSTGLLDAGKVVAAAAIDARAAEPPTAVDAAVPHYTSTSGVDASLRGLAEPPWATNLIPIAKVPAVFSTEFRRAENKGNCPLLVPADLGAGAGARPRAASFYGGWAVAYDKPGAPGVSPDGSDCASCGRSAFGIAGTGAKKGGGGHWDKVIRWSDGSTASYGLEGDSGPGYLAYLELSDADCLYNVWSHLGEEHLVLLLQNLRRVEP